MTAANVESKVRCHDQDGVAGRAAAAGAAYAGALSQTDTYFAVRGRRLKLGETLHEAPDATTSRTAELISYGRPDVAGARVSRYARESIRDPAKRAADLAAAHGLHGVVAKRRDLWLIGRTRIRLDG